MKKKVLLILFAMMAMATAMSQNYDFSATASSGQTLYYKIVNGEAQVTSQYSDSPYYSTYPTVALIIPSSVTYNGTTYSVTGIYYDAFTDCMGLTSVTIPNTVTIINGYVFSNCIGLTSVTIPNSVTSIGAGTFLGCSGLTSVILPNSVTHLGYELFRGCTGLTSVTLPDSITYIPDGTFEDCTGLTSITIPNSVETIYNRAFYGCTNLMSVTIPNSVTSIGSSAFYGCSGLTSISIPNLVTSIEHSTFWGCTGLTSVTIPNSVTSIDKYAFVGCTSLTSVTIGNSVTSIGESAFNGCTGLTSLKFLNPIPPTIGSNAFSGTLANILTVHVPCGSLSSYAATLTQFYHFEEEFSSFTVESEDVSMGSVQIVTMPSCTDHTTVLQAMPADGYRFDHWSTGSTDNPYTLTVNEGMVVIAYFESLTQGIEEVDGGEVRIYAADGRIHVIYADEPSALPEIRVYDLMGREVFHATNADETSALPGGVYLVKVGTLPARKVVVIR